MKGKEGKLVSLDYQIPECDTTLSTPHIVIGSAPDAGIRLTDHTVSPHHCEITQADNGKWSVRDLGSVHGTFVNGSQVLEAPLSLGDELSVGELTFVLQEAEAPELPPVEPTTITVAVSRPVVNDA